MNLFPDCQRWDYRRSSFRPAGETVNTGLYSVDVIDQSTAKDFVCLHHYSNSFPAARVSVGLFRTDPFQKEKLVGVSVFGVPMNNAIIPRYTGQRPNHGCELSRFVLRGEEPSNSETFFLGKAMKLLVQEKPEIKSVVSYSDPLPRITAEGKVCKIGHFGTIYMAYGGVHLGRSRKRTLILDKHGQVISERMLSKIKNLESGFAYSEKLLYEAGASFRPYWEHPRDWVERVINDSNSPFRRIKHPGNFVYAWPVGSRLERRHARKQFAPALPYPKRDFLAA